jgi:hypothetical protein
LPYVIELLEDDEEVLIHLSDTLGNLLDCVGGPAFAESILRVLEKLCAVEEISVREKVIRIKTLISVGNRKYQKNSGFCENKRFRAPHHANDAKTNVFTVQYNKIHSYPFDPIRLHLFPVIKSTGTNGNLQ